MQNNIKLFKLNYSGNLEEISTKNLLSNFNLFDILTFYAVNQKRLYIWVSKKVSQSLKSHIPTIREIFFRNYPNLKVIRNIIIEYNSEPVDFFELIEISKSKYREHFRQLEFKLLPVISEINRLKEGVDKNFVAENYNEAIDIAQKVINLAHEIDDYSLEKDMLNFIEEAKSRNKIKQIVRKIETEAEIKLKVFENLIRARNYKEAHNIAQDFKNKYQNDVNLLSIQFAQDLILKDENILFNLREEQQVLKKRVEVLVRKIERFMKASKVFQAGKSLKEIEDLVDKVIDREVLSKLDSIKDEYFNFKSIKKNELEDLSKKAIKFIDKRKISEAIEKFDQIVGLLEQFIE
ncbi:MAG: hypothetical protein ACFFFB_12790 [Candidatus Heimdallarchaeota archaeon]